MTRFSLTNKNIMPNIPVVLVYEYSDLWRFVISIDRYLTVFLSSED